MNRLCCAVLVLVGSMGLGWCADPSDASGKKREQPTVGIDAKKVDASDKDLDAEAKKAAVKARALRIKSGQRAMVPVMRQTPGRRAAANLPSAGQAGFSSGSTQSSSSSTQSSSGSTQSSSGSTPSSSDSNSSSSTPPLTSTSLSPQQLQSAEAAANRAATAAKSATSKVGMGTPPVK